MGSFLSNFGSALTNYEAAKSPLGAGIYQAATGKSPTDASGKPVNNIGTMLANSIHARYKRGSGPTDSNGQPVQPKQPGDNSFTDGMDDGGNIANDATKLQEVNSDPSDANQDVGAHAIMAEGPVPTVVVRPPSAGGSAAPAKTPATPGSVSSIGNPNDPSRNALGQIPSYMGINVPQDGNDPFGSMSSINVPQDDGSYPNSYGDPYHQPLESTDSNITFDGPWPDGEGGGGSPGDQGADYYDNEARGGISGAVHMARIAESGPEAVGGQIVTQPSFVQLEKGEAVVPLTPRAGNKLQPDLLEGHVMSPHTPGIGYSRYKSYGKGRGLMR